MRKTLKCHLYRSTKTFTMTLSFTTTATTSPLTDVFTFSAGPLPLASKLTFPAPASFTRQRAPCKRARPLTDVDGESSSTTHKKKRRLRLLLITSRLSLPFSAPPTHIVDRGSSKIAVWAKQKALGRNLLRKAAILNRIRRRAAAAREEREREKVLSARQAELESARLAFLYGSPNGTHTRPAYSPYEHDDNDGSWYGGADGVGAGRKRQQLQTQFPRREYIPLPPSPLGLSNYDALDLDDDFDEEEGADWGIGGDGDGDREDGMERNGMSAEGNGGAIYSDFNVLEPTESVIGDYDNIDSYGMSDLLTPEINAPLDSGSLPLDLGKKKQEGAPESKALEMIKEKERQKKILFVNFG